MDSSKEDVLYFYIVVKRIDFHEVLTQFNVSCT